MTSSNPRKIDSAARSLYWNSLSETLAAAEDLSKQKHDLERELEKVEIEIAFRERVVADETRIAGALR